MTFNFRIWPVHGFDPLTAAPAPARPNSSVAVRGPRLIARWQCGADGRLESRWVRKMADLSSK